MGKNLLKIRHLAFASEHPGKAAEFYKSAFGFQELSRFGLDPDRPDEARRPSGVFLTDGTLNVAILKFPENMLGKAGDQGIHHFGVVVEDVEAWPDRIQAVTPEDVNAALRDLVANPHYLVASLLPDHNATAAQREAAHPIVNHEMGIR